MKGWGKSPPRTWQQGRHGKPRLEQDQIGTSRGLARGAHRLRCPGRSREPISNGRSRGMIVADPGLGLGTEQNPAYRPSGIFLGLPRFALLEADFFLRAYRPLADLRPVGLALAPSLSASRNPNSDYPRISVFWQRSRPLAAVNLLSGNGRLGRLTTCEYFVCSVYVPAVRACLSRHTSKHG